MAAERIDRYEFSYFIAPPQERLDQKMALV